MERRILTLGLSPCPNDTFIFDALLRGEVSAPGLAFEARIEDVETLNALACAGALDLTKVSYGAFGGLRDEYCLLRAGGALGRGCGPLVVARDEHSMESLRGGKIAVPGVRTTAHLLMRLFDPALGACAVPMPFDRIMDVVVSGEADAGLIIHESRFTYPLYGLSMLLDLGQWWEGETGCLIPLGSIIGRRALGPDLIGLVDGLIRESVLHARRNPAGAMPFVRGHAREMDEAVMLRHIGLYVNEHSVDIGPEGERSAARLFAMASERCILPASLQPLFI